MRAMHEGRNLCICALPPQQACHHQSHKRFKLQHASPPCVQLHGACNGGLLIMHVGRENVMHCGDTHESVWSTTVLGIGVTTMGASRLLQKFSSLDGVCVWPPGDVLQ